MAAPTYLALIGGREEAAPAGWARAARYWAARWYRPVWVGLTGIGAVYAFAQALFTENSFNGYDVYAYWAVDGAAPYAVHVAPAFGAFLYAPPLAWLFDPLGLLPFEVVRVGWLAMEVAILAVMTGPLTFLAAQTPPIITELRVGNVTLLMAGAIVLGLRRWPALWAFPILAKVTPVVGLAWFVGRKDWRGLGLAAAATALVVAVSGVIAPGLWVEWAGVLQANAGVVGEVDLGPPWLRLPLAVVVAWWAGRTNRAWLVPPAVAMSFGHLWLSAFAVLVAVVPLISGSQQRNGQPRIEHIQRAAAVLVDLDPHRVRGHEAVDR